MLVLNLCFYLMLSEFNLGRAKFVQQHETTVNFNFYTVLDNSVTQCFASIRLTNVI